VSHFDLLTPEKSFIMYLYMCIYHWAQSALLGAKRYALCAKHLANRNLLNRPGSAH
jgi:hypothetical protein